MTFGLALVAAGLLLALVPTRWARPGVSFGVALLLAGVLHDVVPRADLAGIRALLADLAPLALVGDDPSQRGLLLGALVWCGPAADLVVRLALEATKLPAPEAAADAGFGAGRWIGRLERWMIVTSVAAGQPGLAVIPIGGKALFRYAEVVADARVDHPRLRVPSEEGGGPGRDALVEYVIVGSLASWAQAIGLGLVAAGG